MASSWSTKQVLPARAALMLLLVGAAIEASGAEVAYRQPQIFEVGGPGAVWKAHSSPTFFEDWAATITFRQGDVLQFNVEIATVVYQVPETTYTTCNPSASGSFANWFLQPYITPKASLQLLELGMNYFFDNGYCKIGERVKVNVLNMSIPGPASAPLPGSLRPIQFFQVAQNISSMWAVPLTPDYYIDWAKNTSFFVGDKLGFNFTNGLNDYTYNKRDISIVPYENWEDCYISQANYIWRSSVNVTYEFTSPGTVYFMASNPWLCLSGMRFVAYVYPAAGTASPAPSPMALPPTSAGSPVIVPPASVPSTAPSTPSPTASTPIATAPSEAPSSLVSPAASPPTTTTIPSSGNSLYGGHIIVGAIVAAAVAAATASF